MTEIELKKEANEGCVCTTAPMRVMYVTGYLAGAKHREKRIEELTADNRLLEERGSEILVQLLDMNKKFKEAKGLLQKLVDISEKTYPDDNAFDVDFEELLRETEQFLNQKEENKGNE